MVVRDPLKIGLVRCGSPGMIVEPPALVVLMIETEQAEEDSMHVEPWTVHHIDIGTAAMSMTTMAQSLGLGSCPVTSFSKSAVSAMLELPSNLSPEFILILGHPAGGNVVTRGSGQKSRTAREMTYWDKVGVHEP
jgi:nitroreductase